MEISNAVVRPANGSQVNPSTMAGSNSSALRPLLRPSTRVRSDEGRSFGVRQALQAPSDVSELEVYIGWDGHPVGVAMRRDAMGVQSWAIAGPLLRERVLTAVAPLELSGWQLDGTFLAAARWDMSRGTGGDLYEGCWLKMRRQEVSS